MKKRILFLMIIVALMASGCIIKKQNKEEQKPADLTIDSTKLVGYLVADARCKETNCDTSYLKQSLLSIFPTIEFKEYDYNSPEGKKLYADYGLKLLPAFLFTKKVETEANYSNVKNYIVANKDLLALNVGASFDPSKEICNNNIDDTGNGLMDCADPDCTGNLVCREEAKGKLDLFVMSMCPYGTKALDAMAEVIKNFGDKITFNIHFIANKNADGTFQSLHGQTEVDENIRELCAVKYYPDNYKYMDYIWCRNKDINGDWKTCAKNFPKINTCFTGTEGKELLTENIKLANELQIGASPTWLANNKYQFSGITAEDVKTNVCKYNDLGDACKAVLNSAASVPAGSCN